MRQRPERLELIPQPDPAALRRWGVADCGRVDRRALNRSLARLRDDEVEPPLDTTRLVRHIRDRYHGVLIGLIEDAVSLAGACEAAHSREALWPHGLSDRMAEILEALEAHQQREDAVVFPMLLAGTPRVSQAATVMAAEHARIREMLDAVRTLTLAFEAPPVACASWRVLYVLARKIDLDVRAQMRLEECELFGGGHP